MSRQTVISIENGRYLPSLPLAFRIARFFELPLDKMFDPEAEETQQSRAPHAWEADVARPCSARTRTQS